MHNLAEKCQVCGGVGHSYYACLTKRKCDLFAKKNNDNANWGAWKFEKYYNGITAANKEKEKALAKEVKFGACLFGGDTLEERMKKTCNKNIKWVKPVKKRNGFK